MAGPLPILRQHAYHPRTFRDLQYVYPVLSRRSKGISIGVNLNADKVCNFDCIYCQVDRTTAPPRQDVDAEQVVAELRWMMEEVTSGRLFTDPAFNDVPETLRRLRDVAFSGDGEPTTAREFPDVVRETVNLAPPKMVLITNATMFHRPKVLESIDLMMAHGGEVWGKLDAGTEEYYHLIDRTVIKFQRVLDNLQMLACRHPLVIQSLFMRVNNVGPSADEISAYIGRLNDIQQAGGQLTLVQAYTVARRPAETTVSALPDAELDALAARIRDETQLPTEVYYGR